MEELIEKLNVLLGKTLTTEVATVYLDLATEKVLNRMYPFGYDDDTIVPTKYQMLLVELASRLYNRRGGEGELSHSENGISRSYGSVDDEDILSRIVPVGRVF